MNALPCQSNVGAKELDRMADETIETARRKDALAEMIDSSHWLMRWHDEDDSADRVTACMELGLLLMLAEGLPAGRSVRADAERDAFANRHAILRDCFIAWATKGKPSHLDRYMEAERLAREADDMEDEA